MSYCREEFLSAPVSNTDIHWQSCSIWQIQLWPAASVTVAAHCISYHHKEHPGASVSDADIRWQSGCISWVQLWPAVLVIAVTWCVIYCCKDFLGYRNTTKHFSVRLYLMPNLRNWQRGGAWWVWLWPAAQCVSYCHKDSPTMSDADMHWQSNDI